MSVAETPLVLRTVLGAFTLRLRVGARLADGLGLDVVLGLRAAFWNVTDVLLRQEARDLELLHQLSL
jgi:hypothetical protein